MEKSSLQTVVKGITIPLYILCAVVSCGLSLSFMSNSASPSAGKMLIVFVCSIIQFAILFNKALKVKAHYLFPFVFLLPIAFYAVRATTIEWLAFGLAVVSTPFALLKPFFVMDIIGLILLCKSEKTRSPEKAPSKKTCWDFPVIRLSLVLCLAFVAFEGWSLLSHNSWNGVIILPLWAVCGVLIYLIFPTKWLGRK